jgi:hypothetical protein
VRCAERSLTPTLAVDCHPRPPCGTSFHQLSHHIVTLAGGLPPPGSRLSGHPPSRQPSLVQRGLGTSENPSRRVRQCVSWRRWRRWRGRCWHLLVRLHGIEAPLEGSTAHIDGIEAPLEGNAAYIDGIEAGRASERCVSSETVRFLRKAPGTPGTAQVPASEPRSASYSVAVSPSITQDGHGKSRRGGTVRRMEDRRPRVPVPAGERS